MLQIQHVSLHQVIMMVVQVLRLAMTLGAAAVRGNHDDQALSAYRKLGEPAQVVPLACQ